MRRRAGGGGRLFTLLPFAPVMGAPVLRRLFARLPFATIPFMFIYKEDSFSDVIRRKAAQKAALLFFYSRPPQAGTFSYKSPAAGRLLSAPQAPYQSAAQAPLFLPCLFPFFPKGTVAFDPHAAFFTVPFPIFVKRHGSVRPSRRFFIPCLFLFFPKGTVACTTPIRAMSNRDAGEHLLLSLAWRRRGEIRPAAFFFIKKIALRRSFYQNTRPAAFFFIKKNAPTHSLFYQINCADALLVILK